MYVLNWWTGYSVNAETACKYIITQYVFIMYYISAYCQWFNKCIIISIQSISMITHAKFNVCVHTHVTRILVTVCSTCHFQFKFFS